MILQFHRQPRPFGITARELEVLVLVAEGLSNEEIAGTLCLASRTVKSHLSAIMRKLDTPSRLCAILQAHVAHLVDLDVCARRYAERQERAAA